MPHDDTPSAAIDLWLDGLPKQRDKRAMLTEDLPEWIIERVAGDMDADESPVV